MQRYAFYPIPSQKLAAWQGGVERWRLLRRYSTSLKAVTKNAKCLTNSNDTPSYPDKLVAQENHHLPLRVLGALLNGPEGPVTKPPENYGRWSLTDYRRRIDGLIAAMPPESAVAAVTYVVSSSSVPGSLQSRVLVKASHAFLRHGYFSGALSMYKLLLSQRFAPPLSLVAAMYRAANVQIARRAKPNPKPKDTMDPAAHSFIPIDDRLLALLLSTLESSRRPEIMESIVEKHVAQSSGSCINDSSVVASMIRGYQVAGQLDGCYAWFYCHRNSALARHGPTPTAPYVCLMSASRKLDPKNTRALYRIVKMMQEDGIPLTTLAYNEILASEVRCRNFRRVFSLFVAFRGSLSTLQPDAYTFSLVFDALWKNETGPRFETSLHPPKILHDMLHAAESSPSILTIFNSNVALRYFVHIGDFQSTLRIVDAVLSHRVPPNALTIRWVLEEILKRCQAAYTAAASLELENWTRPLIGGLTRDHFAHTVHLLDIVRSTRAEDGSYGLTRAAYDALQLVHNMLVSRRPLTSFTTKEQLEENPVLSRIRDVLQVCADPARGLA